MNLKRNENGFTIIEVVLVLAIAGLIFLMVFVAYPALSRNRQDTQRRNNLTEISGQLSQYMTNNSGKLPSNSASSGSTTFGGFMERYLKDSDFQDPKEGNYKIEAGTAGDKELPIGTIQYIRKATCDGENATGSGTERQAALRVKLASSGHFCLSVK